MNKERKSQSNINFKYLLLAIVPMITTVIIGLISYFSGLFFDLTLDETFFSDFTDAIKLLIRCILLSLVFIIWYKKLEAKNMSENPAKEEDGPGPIKFSHILLFSATGLLLGALFKAVGGLTLYALPSLTSTYSDHMQAMNIFNSSIPAIIIFVFAVPFIEEIIFRCITFQYLEKFCNRFMLANVISALIYAIYQFSFIHGVIAFLLGLIYSFTAKKTDDLLTAVIVHSSVNLAMALIPLTISSYPMICCISIAVSAALLLLMALTLWKKYTK